MESDESLRNAAANNDVQADGAAPPPLIGSVGADFIRKELSSGGKKPPDALADIRARGSLRNPLCTPLLTMLELQKVPPVSAHRALLEEVRRGPASCCCRALISKQPYTHAPRRARRRGHCC